MDMFPLVSAATDEVVKAPVSALDSALNILVPLAVFAMFGFMVYKNFTTEIDALIAWVRKQMADDPNKQQVPINNPYMADGNIIYR